MNLIAVTVTATITASSWSIDVTPIISVTVPELPRYACAMVTTPIIWVREGCDLTGDLLVEELLHVDQQAALGWVFFPAYFLTAGEAFEPYSPRSLEWWGFSHMWIPPPDLPRVPFLRLNMTAGHAPAVSFWPMGGPHAKP